MRTDQHIYETTFIVNASLEDPQVESIIGRVQDVVVKSQGTINAVNKWGRKRLAYPIHKKNNGFYVNIEVLAPGSIAGLLRHFYMLEENILRHLTVRLDKKALLHREKNKPVPEAISAPEPADEAPKEPSREPLFSEPAQPAQ